MSVAVSLLAVFSLSAWAKADVHPSEFRPGVTVEQLYDQDLEGVYSTTWFGRLEKSDGPWRDVYVETSEKFVNKGIISFNCTVPQADVGLILYSFGEYGDATRRRFVRVRFADRQSWADDRFEPLMGEDPPYALFLAARGRFCPT